MVPEQLRDLSQHGIVINRPAAFVPDDDWTDTGLAPASDKILPRK